jgi:hypothetical protein
MAGASHGPARGGGVSASRVSVAIDLAALEALPIRTRGRIVEWNDKEDEALRLYWPTRDHTEVARILGKSRDACVKRYKVLARGEA